MNELLQGFSLGSAAILTNACMLPLYPGLIAFLAGSANNDRTRRATGWLGVLVLAGILTMMLFIGTVLYLLQASFGGILQVALPLIYALVIVFGILMLTGRNPFSRLATAQAPVLRNPYVTAYVYGLFFGPMTLPCTGPIITTAFALGAGEGGSLANELLYFLAFGVGFGWPLVILPVVAVPAQRRFLGWLSNNHTLLNRVSGLLLVAVGLFGFLTELLPQWLPDFEFSSGAWWLYWAVVIGAMIAVGWYTYRQQNPPAPGQSATSPTA